jgi:hypothetical protein
MKDVISSTPEATNPCASRMLRRILANHFAVMKTQAIHESVGLLPADSVAYRSPTSSSSPRPHDRWGEALSDPQWGWRLAYSHHINNAPLPASIEEPHVRRAYRFLQGARDDHMAQALAVRTNHNLAGIRAILQGLLCAKDISPRGIAEIIDLEVDVVELYEGLFFSVRNRPDIYAANLSFPMSRIGAVVEAEKGYTEVDQTLMRVGRDYGWREVARLAGLIQIEEGDQSVDTMLADMENTMAANARMLARAGHLNNASSSGIRHGKSLMLRAKQMPSQRPDDDPDMRAGFGSLGMTGAVMDGFLRMSQADLEHRLALQRQATTSTNE